LAEPPSASPGCASLESNDLEFTVTTGGNMKTIIAIALAICGIGLVTGCEHEHEHHHGYYGAPAPYQYGHGGYYYNSYNGQWEHQ